MYIYIIHYSINCIYKILQTLLRIVFGGVATKILDLAVKATGGCTGFVHRGGSTFTRG